MLAEGWRFVAQVLPDAQGAETLLDLLLDDRHPWRRGARRAGEAGWPPPWLSRWAGWSGLQRSRRAGGRFRLRANRPYRATVSRHTPLSRSMRRSDQSSSTRARIRCLSTVFR